jgi:calmodulin
MPMKEYKFLMNNENEMTFEDLKELLKDNEITSFDPLAEAFKAYDPHGTGFVDTDVLRSVFQSLGFGEITDEDLQILVETGDVDGDGKISLEDFRKMIEFNKQKEEQDKGDGKEDN